MSHRERLQETLPEVHLSRQSRKPAGVANGEEQANLLRVPLNRESQ